MGGAAFYPVAPRLFPSALISSRGGATLFAAQVLYVHGVRKERRESGLLLPQASWLAGSGRKKF